MKTTAMEILNDGFNAIMVRLVDNALHGRTTDVGALLDQLREKVRENAGHEYPRDWMIDMFDAWRQGAYPTARGASR